MVKFLKFALGVRFAPGEGGVDEALAKKSMETLLGALAPKDLQGLELYGGQDAVTVPGQTAFIAVIKGGSLTASRRIYRKLSEALEPALSAQWPFIENNRVAHILESLTYYGQVGAEGSIAGGEGCFGLRCCGGGIG